MMISPGSNVGLLRRLWNFGYEAIVPKGVRKQPPPLMRAEDAELTPEQRRQLIANTRDIQRNFPVAAWAIRKHLNYVTSFNFQSRVTGEAGKALNKKVEALVNNWGTRWNCDISQRHPFRRLLRMMEARAALDGDVFPHRISTGQLQFIEGDLVRTPWGGLPEGYTPADFNHGVKTNDYGAAELLCICKRQKTSDAFTDFNSGQFDQLLPTENVFQHGFFDRFDQVRGISPLTSAMNLLRDSHEGFDFALAKMKVSQLYGLQIFTDKTLGQITGNDISSPDYAKLRLDKPLMLRLTPGERAEWLESKTPSGELQSFQVLVIQLALKALDIPYSFYSEDFTNYSGQRLGWLLYEQSAAVRRADIYEFLIWVTDWVLWILWADGFLTQGEYEDAVNLYEWVHAKLPWLDPLKEWTANKIRLELGATNRRDLLKEEAKDWDDNLSQLQIETEQLRNAGLLNPSAPIDPAVIQELLKDEPV